MSFNICRGTLGTASSHQREQNFGYGDKADRERDSGDGELLADHSPTKWISQIEKRDPDLCLGRVGAPLAASRWSTWHRRAVRDGGVGGLCAGRLMITGANPDTNNLLANV